MDDAELAGFGQMEQSASWERPLAESQRADSDDARLPLFPPGPADRDRWAEILSDSPWLAPAVEPGVRSSSDELAVVVDAARADQLRTAGNGVVAVQGAAAFILLAQRAGVADELGIGGGYELGDTECTRRQEAGQR